MWVWTSMKPGRPVNLERSMIWAWGGVSEGFVVTELLLSSSMRTMALVQSLPRVSQSLPNLTAFTDLGEAGDCASERVGRMRKEMQNRVREIFMESGPFFWFEVLRDGFSAREARKKQRRWCSAPQENPQDLTNPTPPQSIPTT